MLDLVFLQTWHVVFRDLLDFPKGSQATCHVGLGTLVGSGTNAVYRASSSVDLVYMELFRVSAVISMFL